MDNSIAMRLFVRVVESGSFSKAAELLGLVPSSVSRQITALEGELGVTLLNRTTRKLRLTEAGELYYEKAVRILRAIQEANEAVGELSKEPRGVLHISTPVILARLHIVPVIAAFIARYPGIDVELNATDELIDLVETGTDLAVRLGELRDSTLIARRLAPHRRVLCASPAYLRARGRPIKPSDILRHEAIAFRRTPEPNTWLFQRRASSERITVSGRFWSNDIDAVAAAAREGLGITLLPEWMVSADLQSKTLTPLLEDYTIAPEGRTQTALYAVYPRAQHVPRKVRLFLDFLHERLKQLAVAG
jgi:DNA-binding transcriptional LysR family regulator